MAQLHDIFFVLQSNNQQAQLQINKIQYKE